MNWNETKQSLNAPYNRASITALYLNPKKKIQLILKNFKNKNNYPKSHPCTCTHIPRAHPRTPRTDTCAPNTSRSSPSRSSCPRSRPHTCTHRPPRHRGTRPRSGTDSADTRPCWLDTARLPSPACRYICTRDHPPNCKRLK